MTDEQYKDMIHSITVPATLSPKEQIKRYQPLIDFLQKETPEKLYRFRQCNELNLDAFDQDKLFFSPGNKMNDDFDSMLYFNKKLIDSKLKQFAESESFQNFLNSIKQGIGFPSIIQNIVPTDVLTTIRANIIEMNPADTNIRINNFLTFFNKQFTLNSSELSQIIRTSIKFACFSNNIYSAAMWGYYADDGKGFALAYDFRNGNFSNCNSCNVISQCPSSNSCCLARVIYDNECYDASMYAAWLLARKIFLEQGIISPFNNSSNYLLPCPDLFSHTKVMLHKAKAWEHEQEWRLSFSSNSIEMNQKEHPWIKKVPTAIYLGRNISSIHEKILCNIASAKKIPIYKMTINVDDSSYKLHPKAYNSNAI